jgi:hypothetical protein
MNTLHAIYALSTTGAALFYAAGYLTRRRSPPPWAPQFANPSNTELAANLSNTELATVRAQLTDAQVASEQLRTALGEAEQRKQTVAQQLEQERRARASAEQAKQLLETQLRTAAQQAEQANAGPPRAAISNLELARALEREQMARSKLEEQLRALRAASAPPQGVRIVAADARTKQTTLVGMGPVGRDSGKQVDARLKADLLTARADARAAEDRAGEAEAKLEELRGRQRVLASAESTQLATELKQTRDQLHALEREASELRAAASRSKTDEAELQKLRAASAQAQRQAAELERVRQQLADAMADAAELARLRQQTAELRGGEQRSAADRLELNALRAQLKQVQNELEGARRKAASADSLLEQLDEAKAEVARTADLDRVTAELTESKNEARQLRLDLKVATERIESLEHSAQEAAGLRTQTAELEAAKAEVAKLRVRVRTLESSLLVAGKELIPPAPVRPFTGPASPSLLDCELTSLLAQSGMRSAVVADPMGLLIAAAGDGRHHEGMGAMAGVASQLVDRATDLLPVARVHRMHLADENNLVVSCDTVRWQHEDVVLVTLSSGMPAPALLRATAAAIRAIGSESSAR